MGEEAMTPAQSSPRKEVHDQSATEHKRPAGLTYIDYVSESTDPPSFYQSSEHESPRIQ